MARYLVVAHQTATSPELRARLMDIAKGEPGAKFTLLVPASPRTHWRAWDDLELVELAREQAAEASRSLQAAGLALARVEIGAREPLEAIEDELRLRPGYDRLVISTLHPGISRWLKLDLVNRARQKFRLDVLHVVAGGAPQGPAPGGDDFAAEHDYIGFGTPAHEAHPDSVGGKQRPRGSGTPRAEAAAPVVHVRPTSLQLGAGEGARPVLRDYPGEPEAAALFTAEPADAVRAFFGRPRLASMFASMRPNPGAGEGYLRLLASLWAHAGVEPHLRELVALRVAMNTHSDYQWHEHVLIAREIGVPDDRIAALEHWQWSEQVRFDPGERAALAYVDALCAHDGAEVVAAELRARLTESQVVGLTLLVGFSLMSAVYARGMDVRPEDTFVGWALYGGAIGR
jgi:alkylhydroperoxidase family enzyme